jgi:hypothetical protein
MSKHHWVSVIGALLVGGSGYLLIAIIGCCAADSAVDKVDWEAAPDVNDGRPLPSLSLKELHLDSSNAPVEDAKEDSEGFRFPEDRGGQILSKLLPPSEKAVPLAEREVPAPRRHPPPGLEKPLVPLPAVPAEMPRLPAGKSPALRPRPLPEDLPLAGHLADPTPPQAQTLHAGDRIRIPSVDASQPIPLPILAQPASNRAPLDDVTAEASRNAALATSPLARSAPVPFLKIDLPDPFENRVKPAATPAENVTPTHTGSRPSR